MLQSPQNQLTNEAQCPYGQRKQPEYSLQTNSCSFPSVARKTERATARECSSKKEPFFTRTPQNPFFKSSQARVSDVIQRTQITVNYNYQPAVPAGENTPAIPAGNRGFLRAELADLAGKDQAYFNSFPPDAYGAIIRELNNLDPANFIPGEPAYIGIIKQKVKTAVQAQLAIAWVGDTVTATMGGTKVGEIDFVDYDGDGKMWVFSMETKSEATTGQTWRHLGIGLKLLQEGVNKYGQIYASKGGQREHDPDDDGDDTRWLTRDGAGLINAAVAKGIIPASNFYNPIAQINYGGDEEEDF